MCKHFLSLVLLWPFFEEQILQTHLPPVWCDTVTEKLQQHPWNKLQKQKKLLRHDRSICQVCKGACTSLFLHRICYCATPEWADLIQVGQGGGCQYSVFSFHQLLIITEGPAGRGGGLWGSEREGKALWPAASWQHANLGGVVLGVGGSSSWISAPGHGTALLHLVFLHQQGLWQ